MIFALQPTLVLHSWLKRLMFFIFHMFRVHMSVLCLSLLDIFFTALRSHPHIGELIHMCKHAHAAH